MAALKNSDRDDVLRRVLTETFTPRFADIKKQAQVALRANLAAEHPQFVKLVKDVESLKYLAKTNVSRFYLIDGKESVLLASPQYGRYVDIPASGNRGSNREDHSTIGDDDTVVPQTMGHFSIDDAKMLKAYKAVWADYVAARGKLSALLYSYATREKFVVDFPEFAKYLPPVVTKAKLPVVIVKDVRRELSKLGVPQA